MRQWTGLRCTDSHSETRGERIQSTAPGRPGVPLLLTHRNLRLKRSGRRCGQYQRGIGSSCRQARAGDQLRCPPARLHIRRCTHRQHRCSPRHSRLRGGTSHHHHRYRCRTRRFLQHGRPTGERSRTTGSSASPDDGAHLAIPARHHDDWRRGERDGWNRSQRDDGRQWRWEGALGHGRSGSSKLQRRRQQRDRSQSDHHAQADESANHGRTGLAWTA